MYYYSCTEIKNVTDLIYDLHGFWVWYRIDLWCKILLTRCLRAHDAVCGSGHELFMSELLDCIYSWQMNGAKIGQVSILLVILNCLCLYVF